MTKQEILNEFDDINYVYNNSSKHETLSWMLDELLKEQETKQVKQVELYGKENWYGLVCKCPDCKAIWMGGKSETHFCPNCGQAVKWDDTN